MIKHYKYKKFLAWCGIGSAIHILEMENNKELSEEQKTFVSLWTNKLSNKECEIFLTYEEQLRCYEIHDFNNTSYITLCKDNIKCKIELNTLKNGQASSHFMFIPISVGNRLIDKFNHEIEKRTSVLKKIIKETIDENIKSL